METADTSIPLLPGPRLDHAEALGRTTCVFTRLEFQSLSKEREVHVETAGILRKLCVLGYTGGVTIVDAEAWEEMPLRFRRV